jgi:membrane associated rhomboid family serine protease
VNLRWRPGRKARVELDVEDREARRLMARPGVPLLMWTAWIGALAVVLWVWAHDPLLPALLSGATAAALAVAVYVLLRPGRPVEARRLPDVSVPSVVLALAAAMLLLGLAFGTWIVLIGAWVLVAGLVGLARELAGQRSGVS